jgi:cytochrome c peroxidase
MTFAHAANAIAGFLVEAFTFDDAPWDRFLRGDASALTEEQLAGGVAYMSAPCAICHTGPVFSDDAFHNVALAQFGPGRGNGPSGRDDFGRMNVSGDPGDRYRFRTSPLRNVELTGPYGHAGQFADLAAFVDHYSRNADKLRAYADADIPEPLLRGTLVDNTDAVIANRSPFILPAAFDQTFVQQVTAFLRSLTDDRARHLDDLIPPSVPSGLPVMGDESNP